jgi:hypothetical protein
MQDRGEGDVLLFINDLSTLSEAKRFSNVICDSQARALQHEITKLEQEIKEDMVEDVKRFNKAEALRKRQFEEKKLQRRRPYSQEHGKGKMDGKAVPRNAMLDAIRQRGAPSDASQVGDHSRSAGSSPGNPHGSSSTDGSSRVSLLSAIRSRTKVDGEEGQDHTERSSSSASSSSRAAMLSAIQSQPRRNLDETSGGLENPPDQAQGARSSLLAAIRQRPSTPSPSVGSTDPRSVLLAPDDGGIDDVQKGQSAGRGGGSQAALLAAIRQRSVQPKQEGQSEIRADGAADEEFEPRPYRMESNFISTMKERLMSIKATFEDIEMELESLHSVWDGTARYLAEDPTGSSSEYVFGLLNRFLLDVKVAKTLLFRKGLSFASEANALLPHACESA